MRTLKQKISELELEREISNGNWEIVKYRVNGGKWYIGKKISKNVIIYEGGFRGMVSGTEWRKI